MKISKDIPLQEITFRKYEKPHSNGRELVKKLCLSIGLLQPGDSRDIIVDILYVLLKNRKRTLSCTEIEQLIVKSRTKHKLPLLGIASSNVRRQLKRLRSLFLIEKVKNRYRITEFVKLSETFEEKVEMFMLHGILQRVREYFNAVDEEFFKQL